MAGKKSFVLRISEEMYMALEKWAADEFRSVNGQIEFLLSKEIKARQKSAGSEKSAEKKTEK